MANYITIIAIVMLAAGCDVSPTTETVGRLPRTQNKGQFLVPIKNLPETLVELAAKIERFPLKCSPEEFEFVLNAAGLNKQSTWYKDYRHEWHIDSDLRTPVDRKGRRYRISISNVYWGDLGPDLKYARIEQMNRPHSADTLLWKVEYQ